MTNYPRKDQSAKTGSNVRGEPLRAHVRARLAQEVKRRERLAKEYHAQVKALFSKADLKRAAKIRYEVIREFQQASLKAGGDAERVAELRTSAHGKLQRRLAREFPAYKQVKALQKAHRRAQDKVVPPKAAAQLLPDVSINWGDVLTAEPIHAAVAGPPYTTFDVQLIDFSGFVVEDQSFANPDIGHLVNNFVYDHDQSTSIVAGLFGILPIGNGISMTSCGVSFTTPSSGRLKVGALLRNFYNKIVLSVKDKWGFSSADVGVSVDFLVLVVRGTTVEVVTKTLAHASGDSGGDNVDRVLTDIDTETPYSVSVETATHLNANESVLVLAGSQVFISSVLDDMHCHMNAVLWWKLEKLYIDMAVDIIT